MEVEPGLMTLTFRNFSKEIKPHQGIAIEA